MAKEKSVGAKNLIPIRDTETAKARGKLGGIRSGEAKREKKQISNLYAAMLAKKYNVTTIAGKKESLTGVELLERAMTDVLMGGGSPAVQMIKEMREATEGVKLEVDNKIEIIHTFDPGGI